MKNYAVLMSFVTCAAVLSGALLCGGCASTGGSVAIADRAMTLSLDNFNQSPLAKRYGGPFRLSEYKRTVSNGIDPSRKKPAVRVDYDLQRDVKFSGQPRSFTVWVWNGKNGKKARVSGR
jgi:hypothetical protein